MPSTPELTVYFNGACPLCAREIAHYQRIAAKTEAPIAWVDVGQATEACPFTRAESLKRLHGIDAAGRTLVGVATFEAIWTRLPGWRLLAAALKVPPIRGLAHLLYERIAVPFLWRRNRHLAQTAGEAA